jgi:hypothetical protein
MEPPPAVLTLAESPLGPVLAGCVRALAQEVEAAKGDPSRAFSVREGVRVSRGEDGNVYHFKADLTLPIPADSPIVLTVEEADIILFMIDARAGLTPDDIVKRLAAARDDSTEQLPVADFEQELAGTLRLLRWTQTGGRKSDALLLDALVPPLRRNDLGPPRLGVGGRAQTRTPRLRRSHRPVPARRCLALRPRFLRPDQGIGHAWNLNETSWIRSPQRPVDASCLSG